MRTRAALVTGAGGEVGRALVPLLVAAGHAVVTLDVSPPDPAIRSGADRDLTGSILDRSLLERIEAEFDIDLVFHLAALLSTRSEFTPVAAHDVNVAGTLNLLEFAQHQGESHGRPVVFVYPSSIAVYGLPDRPTKALMSRVREDQWETPRTMYGCNKLYCEHLGRYYAEHYKQLAAHSGPRVDFRCVRFPGLISPVTVPSGGLSDYASGMLHAAAAGRAYACFVEPDTRLPFLVMPDAIDALIGLAGADGRRLTRRVYNVSAFSATADEIRGTVVGAFPEAALSYEPDSRRQAIVNSWPADVDDTAARTDWGFAPVFRFARAFSDHLIPMVRQTHR